MEGIAQFIVDHQKGLFIFCGLYLLWGSLRNFDWFNAGHSARKWNRLVGRGGTRLIYFLCGIGCIGLSVLSFMTDIPISDMLLVLKNHPTQFIDFISPHI